MPRSPSTPFTANDARKLTEKALDIHGQIAQQETQTILELVRAAANAGERNVCVDMPFKHRELIKKRLEAVNFTVKTYSDQREGDSTTVSW
jgi:hypothetical protein